jgi:hypothetical protein
MTTPAHPPQPMHPMTSRIPKSTLDAAREVVRHCFESASLGDASRLRPALTALGTAADARIQPSTR